MMETAFAPDLVWVAEGGAGVAQTLLDKPFDHVFFTGSPAVGRKVMAQAAQHLTPVTLELGGKSPVIVGPDADIPAAARAIVWGKFANAGQTCIAPDHVYVAAQRMDKFLKAVRAEIARMYGKDPEGQMASGDLSRIVSARHYQRLVDMINQAESMGATIALGGAGDAESRFVAPTVLTGVRPDMTVMREEIFGPILPLIPFEDIDAVIARINKGPKPLALYVFGKDKGFIDRVSTATSSGAVGVNVTLAHYMHLNLPFGGIGNSGIGAAHGEWGFRAFSHEKPVLVNRRAPLASFMPPYKGLKRRKIRMMARLLGR
jgi:aldehyde dehydrogenase (NAD+)